MPLCTISLATLARFWQKNRNQDLNPGGGASPDSFFPSFRPAVAQLTRRGTESLFYENENFTHKKFDEPVACAACVPSHSARFRLFCAFAPSTCQSELNQDKDNQNE
jgi:hypothetical protein